MNVSNRTRISWVTIALLSMVIAPIRNVFALPSGRTGLVHLPIKTTVFSPAFSTPATLSLPNATYTVATTADSGTDSLRQAILDANANPGLDTITFAIGAPGSQNTIQPTSALPTITDPVILDGWSQGGSDYVGPPLVVINGDLAGTFVHGLTVSAGNSTVRGLVINGFASGGFAGIRLQTGDGNWIYGNYIGTDITGTSAAPNGTGLLIESVSDNNLIGTNGDGLNDLTERNLVSGNGPSTNPFGINITTNGNTLAGNYIGVDVSGAADLGNGSIGVRLNGHNNIIGTNGDGQGDADEGNVISGNGSHGVVIVSNDGNIVAGNRIGTDSTGGLDLGNNGHGISFSPCNVGGCDNNIIGTNGDGVSDDLEGNLISGNSQDGIFVSAGGANSVIAGNRIGVNASGTAALPNSDAGVEMRGNNHRLGTNGDGLSDTVERNVISGNGDMGVSLGSISGAADNNVVAGNYIGTDLNGMAAISNASTGLYVENGDANRLGTNGDGVNDASEGNLISGNGAHGLHLYSSFFNTAAGNLIGVMADGVTSLGNTQHGIYIATNSDDNTIGGTGAGQGNVIAYNSGDGVFVDNNCGTAFCIRNRIVGNTILENTGLGIDLAPNGVNVNDPLDPDTGANSLQNYPVLIAATNFNAHLIVTGTLNSTANLTFTLDFYSSSNCDPSGFGEGALYLGAGQATTDGNGDAAFTLPAAGLAQSDDALTATATDPDGNTSEFASCILVVGDEPIAGLQAFNDSPTFLGHATHLTATLTSGTGVSYAWDFGDGGTGSGSTATHLYTATGSYAATVTATNILGSAVATTTITILPYTCAATPDSGITVFASPDADAVQQAVDAASGGDTVKIAGTCAGVYSRAGTWQTVYVKSSLTLAGGYSINDWTTPDPVNTPTVLDALGLGRVVFALGAPLTLENLTLANGDATGSGTGTCPGYGCGGGLYTASSLLLSNVTFHNNHARRAGGAYVQGRLGAVNSDWLDNTCTDVRGGAFEVYDGATITGGLVQGNACSQGGGIYAAAGLVMRGTQFISNTATSPVAGSGGAIYSVGPPDITSVLFQGNQAQTGGGAILHSPNGNESLFIANSQFVNNTSLNDSAQGGALGAFGTTTILSSTFQDNSAPGGAAAGGAIFAYQAITLTQTSLISNVTGGRGGAIYHWGLHEPGNPPSPIYPLVIADSRLAANQAGAEGGGLYFKRQSAAANTPVQLSNTTFENNTAVLEGGGAYLGQPAAITDSLFLDNHSTSTMGGGLYAADRLGVTRTTFQGNIATGAGGAYIAGAFEALDTNWLDNTCTTQGGGAFTRVDPYGETVMTGGLVRGNACPYTGGIIVVGGLAISGTQFISNTSSSDYGGAITAQGSLEITNALFQGNQSQKGGGAVHHGFYSPSDTLTVANTRFINNLSLNDSAKGGALAAFANTTIQSSTFQSNRASGSAGEGGAIYAFKAITLTETTLISNTASNGGAIYHYWNAPLRMVDSLLAGNVADKGGGLFSRQPSGPNNILAQITRTSFRYNAATLNGAGANLGVSALVEDSIFENNTGSNGGGLIAYGPLTVTRSAFTGNEAAHKGGGIFAFNLLALNGTLLFGNHAGANGGGLALESSGATSSQITNSVLAGNTTGPGGASLRVAGTRPLDILHTTLMGGTPLNPGIDVAGTNVQITNAIIVSHSVGIKGSGAVASDHTLFHGNLTDVQGNVSNLNPVYGDPQFSDAANGDFHLALGSAAIDAGTTTSVLSDFEGDLRPIITQSDLGADEFGDSAVGNPGSTITIGWGPFIIILPAGALGGPATILFLPIFPPSVFPSPPWLPIGPGFHLVTTPAGHALTGVGATFLLPVEATITYTDADLGGVDENTLFLAVWDETRGEWVDATTTCAPPGTITRNPEDNKIIVTTCASGEFALIGGGDAGLFQVFLPVITR